MTTSKLTELLLNDIQHVKQFDIDAHIATQSELQARIDEQCELLKTSSCINNPSIILEISSLKRQQRELQGLIIAGWEQYNEMNDAIECVKAMDKLVIKLLKTDLSIDDMNKKIIAKRDKSVQSFEYYNKASEGYQFVHIDKNRNARNTRSGDTECWR